MEMGEVDGLKTSLEADMTGTWFPVTAIKYYRKQAKWLKITKCILLQLWRQKSKSESYKVETEVSVRLVPSGSLGGVHPLPLLASGGCSGPLPPS